MLAGLLLKGLSEDYNSVVLSLDSEGSTLTTDTVKKSILETVVKPEHVKLSLKSKTLVKVVNQGAEDGVSTKDGIKEVFQMWKQRSFEEAVHRSLVPGGTDAVENDVKMKKMSKKKNKPMRNKSQIECHRCKEFGHYKYECPSRGDTDLVNGAFMVNECAEIWFELKNTDQKRAQDVRIVNLNTETCAEQTMELNAEKMYAREVLNLDYCDSNSSM